MISTTIYIDPKLITNWLICISPPVSFFHIIYLYWHLIALLSHLSKVRLAICNGRTCVTVALEVTLMFISRLRERFWSLFYRFVESKIWWSFFTDLKKKKVESPFCCWGILWKLLSWSVIGLFLCSGVSTASSLCLGGKPKLMFKSFNKQ